MRERGKLRKKIFFEMKKIRILITVPSDENHHYLLTFCVGAFTCRRLFFALKKRKKRTKQGTARILGGEERNGAS